MQKHPRKYLPRVLCTFAQAQCLRHTPIKPVHCWRRQLRVELQATAKCPMITAQYNCLFWGVDSGRDYPPVITWWDAESAGVPVRKWECVPWGKLSKAPTQQPYSLEASILPGGDRHIGNTLRIAYLGIAYLVVAYLSIKACCCYILTFLTSRPSLVACRPNEHVTPQSK